MSTQQSWNPQMLYSGSSMNSSNMKGFNLVSYMCEKLNTDVDNVYNQFCAMQNQQKQFKELSNERLKDLENELEELQIYYRQTLLKKQDLIVSNAIKKKINKQEFRKQEKINKALATQRLREEQQALERLAAQGGGKKQKLTIDRERAERLGNEERINLEQTARLIALKEQRYADAEAYSFCEDVLEQILLDVDVQIGLVERRRTYLRVQQEKTERERKVHEMDDVYMQKTKILGKEQNERRSGVESRLSDIEMQDISLQNSIMKGVVHKIIGKDAKGDLAELLNQCLDRVNELKSAVIKEAEDLAQLQRRLTSQ